MVVFTTLLGHQDAHLMTYNIAVLVASTDRVDEIMSAQVIRKPDILVVVIFWIKLNFKKHFFKEYHLLA